MNESRAFASLSSGLLARKGAAKPAMRPQSMGQFSSGMEDLGWNDMGSAVPAAPPIRLAADEHPPRPVAALTPMGAAANASQDFEPAPPIVEQQRAAIAARFAEPVEERIVPSPKARKGEEARPDLGSKAKTAFTLRLEAERHLKLRLACAVTGRSAQQLVTEALDQFLQSRPEIGALAEQVPDRSRNPS